MEPTSVRRLLLICVLLIMLLLIASALPQGSLLPTARQTAFIPKAQYTIPDQADTEGGGIERGTREAHRKAALDTIEHLEAEARLTGTAPVAPIDLKRLRNALQ